MLNTGNHTAPVDHDTLCAMENTPSAAWRDDDSLRPAVRSMRIRLQMEAENAESSILSGYIDFALVEIAEWLVGAPASAWKVQESLTSQA